MSTADLHILSKALDWLAEGRDVALATVIQTWGSAPQPAGSQLLVDAAGNFLGSVSGGCIEAEVITQAIDVLAGGRSKTLEFGVEHETAWKAGLACGGAIRIFVERIDTEGVPLPRLISDIQLRRKVAWVTDLQNGEQRLAYAPDDMPMALAAPLADAFRHDKCVCVPQNHGDIFINVFNPAIRLIVVGAGHIAQHLVPMVRALRYDVIVLDPRAAFASEERFGDVQIVCEWPDDALPRIGLDERTALIALVHDPDIDDPALIHAVSSQAFYVGALGSKKTHAKRVERLLRQGVAAADVDRIHAPIGLDIGALGAAEIALSIVAEVTAVQRGKSAR